MSEILQEIKQSFKYCDFQEGWDGDGAEPMNLKAYTRALELVLKIINDIGEVDGGLEINPCPSGSVDISLRSTQNNSRLLINVKESTVSWYGDDGMDSNSGEINHSQTELFNEELFNWIKTRLVVK